MKTTDTAKLIDTWKEIPTGSSLARLQAHGLTESTKGFQGALLYAPNLTGWLTVADVAVLFIVWLEAVARGLGLVIRLDDRYEIAARRDALLEQRTIHSLDYALHFLGIRPSLTIWQSHRRERYMEVAHLLVNAGLAWEEKQGVIVTGLCGYAEDLVHGKIRLYASQITFKGDPESNLSHMVDHWDYGPNTNLLVIDGNELISEMVLETAIFGVLQELWNRPNRGPLVYAHVPTVADERGVPLHKSQDPADEYLFEKWSRQFRSVEQAKSVLLHMMTLLPYSRWTEDEIISLWGWDKVPRVEQVDISPDGHRIKWHQFFERGIFCDPFYEEAPDDARNMERSDS